ncbi:MAG: PAS domain-containing protein [Fibrobacteria bacterium]|nr:PAS domain-containing protein [Fibrobacteria bacterium]
MNKENHREELEQLRVTNSDFRKSFDQLFAIQNLSVEINDSKSLEDILQSLFAIIPQVIECLSCQVYLFNDENFNLIGEISYSENPDIELIDEEILYWCCKRGTVTVQPGDTEDNGQAIAPMVHGQDIIGAISLDLGKFYISYSEITGLALTTIAGQTSLAIMNIQSRSELEKRAITLNSMKEYIDGVIASLSHAVVTIDPDGKITIFNKKAENFFEIRSKIAIGNKYSVVFPDYLRDTFSKLLQHIQNYENPEPVELTFKTPLYNEERTALLTASVMHISESAKPGMVCVCQDLALSKELERLKELDKMKDNFISMVSHELKTPLASILAYSESLLEQRSNNFSDQKEYLQIINNEGQRLERLVNNILDLSKIESGNMNYHIQPFKPAELVTQCFDIINPRCKNKELSLEITVEEGLPDVMGDFEKIREVMMNLLSNAVKFTDKEGMVKLGAQSVINDPSAQGSIFSKPDYIEFFVEDNGTGIKKKDLNKIFNKFSRIGDAASHSEGSGLGLPVSQGIIESHGNKLMATSEWGKGTKFSFQLKTKV